MSKGKRIGYGVLSLLPLLFMLLIQVLGGPDNLCRCNGLYVHAAGNGSRYAE